MNKTYSIKEIDEVAATIINSSKHKIILLYGEMGAGKTTLIKAIVKHLGSEDTVSSPTFSLVNEYRTVENKIIYHFDFYRIDSENEAMDIGIEEYFYSNNWCLIEWPNKIENLLPLESVICTILIKNKHLRILELKNNG